jgi:hypothetical protein
MGVGVFAKLLMIENYYAREDSTMYQGINDNQNDNRNEESTERGSRASRMTGAQAAKRQVCVVIRQGLFGHVGCRTGRKQRLTHRELPRNRDEGKPYEYYHDKSLSFLS